MSAVVIIIAVHGSDIGKVSMARQGKRTLAVMSLIVVVGRVRSVFLIFSHSSRRNMRCTKAAAVGIARINK